MLRTLLQYIFPSYVHAHNESNIPLEHTYFIEDRPPVNIKLTKAIVISMLAKLLLRGKSILKATIFKGKCKVKLEYPAGEGIQSMRYCKAVIKSWGPGISPGYFERGPWLLS